MVERAHLSVKTKLLVLTQQARCPLCNERLGPLDGIDFDHVVPLALGGADDETNLTAVHRSCHRLKTSGTPATSAGSDIHVIAKSKRLQRATEAHEAVMTLEPTPEQLKTRRKMLARSETKPRKAWPKRKFGQH